MFGDDFFIRAISAVVGPDGHVTAWRPDDVIERHGNVWGAPAEIDRLSNVSVDRSAPSGLRLPPDLDVVLLLGSYHALQSGEDGPGTTAAMNAAILEALRPGGSLVILDRQTSDEAEGATSVRLHQIDADRVMAEARAAGFYFESRRFRPLLLEAPAVTPVNAVMLRFGKRAVIPPYSPRE